MADDARSDTTDNRANSTLGSSPRAVWPPYWLPLVAVLVVAFVWPIVGIGAIRAWQSAQNRVEDWLPASYPETKSLFWFFDRFGSDEFLMISWKGCTLDDPRMAQLETELLKPAEDGKVYFAKADGGQTVVNGLVDQRQLTKAEAKRRVAGLFVGPDGQQSCIIALVSPAGFQNRKSALRWAWHATRLVTGLPEDQIHLAGTTADSVAIDEASSAFLLELNLLSALVCFLILWISLRNVWLVGTVFLTAMLNQHLALAIIYLTGGHIDSVQLLVANLCFVLSMSAGLHYLSYFRKSVASGSQSPALDAVRQSYLPTLLAVATTSLGFISLCTSELTPIRAFGFYAAILVPINATVVIVVLSIHATWTNRLGNSVPVAAPEKSAAASDLKPAFEFTVWSRIVPRISRRPLQLIGVCLLVISGLGAGSQYLKSSVGTRNMLSSDSKLIRDYQWLETNLGPLVPIELVLRFRAKESLSSADTFKRLQAINTLRGKVENVAGITSTLSVLNFLPDLPRSASIESTAKRAAIGRMTNRSKSQLIQSRLLYEDEQEQCWRLSARVAASTTQNYEQVLDRLQQVVDEFQASSPQSMIAVDVSGGVPFLYRTQQQLLADLLRSFSSAFVMIAVTMAVLLRSVMAGLLLMIPNVAPAAVVFGIMGWLGIEVELGTVLTASVMMGVCVDDTLHLLSHFRELRRQGFSPHHAVHAALDECGGAMMQTALVCGVGMLVFSLSPFVPVARFAWLTFALLSIGALSDLILTPAMLLSPLNGLFFREPKAVIPVCVPMVTVMGDNL